LGVFLGFESGLILMFWAFKVRFGVNFFGFLGLATVLATFSKCLAIFFQYSGHSVVECLFAVSCFCFAVLNGYLRINMMENNKLGE
jgi:hypothetical protein